MAVSFQRPVFPGTTDVLATIGIGVVSSELFERKAFRANVLVVGFVVLKLKPSPCAVFAVRVIDHRNEGDDPALLDQPAEVVAGAICCVGGKPIRPNTEAAFSAIQHCLSCTYFGLPDRPCGFNIHDYRAFRVDQVVRGISSLPLCVIDAVFSIGVIYTSTANTVTRFCERHGWTKSLSQDTPRQTGEYSINDTAGSV